MFLTNLLVQYSSVVATFQIYGSKGTVLPICEGHFENLRGCTMANKNFILFQTMIYPCVLLIDNWLHFIT